MAIQYLNGINVSGDVGIGTDTPYKTLDVQGEAVISQNLWIGPVGGNDAVNSLEIGRGRTGNGICFIDMTTDNTTYTDYGFRLIRFSGVNANTELIHRGTGDFRIKGQEASNMRLYTGNSERMSITSSGNVGIGTTSPVGKLSVYRTDNTYAVNLSDARSRSSLYLKSAGNYDSELTFSSGQSNVQLIQAVNSAATTGRNIAINPFGGNVGIGTASPNKKLEVSGDIKISGGDYNGLFFENASGTTKTLLYQHASYNALVIKDIVNNADRVTFKNNGDVGIGTTSPSEKLHIADSGDPKILIEDTSGDNQVGVVYKTVNREWTAGLHGGEDAFKISNGSNFGSNDYFTVKNSGNVGIGTTNPSGLLHVSSGTANEDCVVIIESDTDNNDEASNPRLVLKQDGGSVIGRLGYRNNTNSLELINQTAEPLYLGTSNSTDLTILSNGDVGIGTTSPSEKLHVYNGKAYVTPISYASNQSAYALKIGAYNNTAFDMGLQAKSTSGGSPYMSFRTTTSDDVLTVSLDRVGVGTAIPSEKLHVSGNMRLTGSLKDSSGDAGIPGQILSSTGSGTNWINNDTGDITGVTAGTGLTGGGTSGSVTLNVIGGSGITANANDIAVDATVVRTTGSQTIAGEKTFSNNLKMASTADLKFVDNAGTYPTSGKGFDWTLNNDGARIFAVQPSSDAIDLTFELRDNASANDRFVFRVNEWQGEAYDKYPLIIRAGTQFDLVDSSLYTDGTLRLSNSGALSVTSGTFTGNVGIGTTSPSTALDVVGAATATNFYVGSSGTMQLFDYSGNLHIYSTSGTDIFLGGGIGNRQNDVTIGNGNLNVVGKITADNFVSVQGVDPGNPSATSEELRLSGYGILGNRSAMYITNGHSTGTLRFGIGGAGVGGGVKMLLNSSGNLGINTTTPGSKLDIVSTTGTSTSQILRLRSTSVNPNAPEKVAAFYYNTSTERGYIAVNQYAVTYSTSSDYRLKENVVPISNGIERIKALNPCRFNFIGAGADNIVDGFIAHEAAEVVPESVTGEKDAVNENNEPTYQGIDQSKIVPLLTAALKEAIEKIEQLENRIQTLENN